MPFFGTMFFGAFNDNVFRNALVTFIVFFGASASSGNNPHILVNLVAFLFILPFFLFSATAGQIADKYEKSSLIRRIKLFEIVIMLLAAIAFYYKSISFLIVLVFLMGSQSAFFGPIKYSIIPDHLKPDEIVGGNAMVEMGTFVAILLGLILGVDLAKMSNTGNSLNIGFAVCLIACIGWLMSLFIPKADPPAPGLKININPITQTWKTIRLSRKVHSVFLSILAIAWFWFLGMAYVTQMPKFTSDVLHGTEDVYKWLMVTFTVGIALGSLLCERLSDKKVELGLVPLGSIGLSIFGFDLFRAYASPDVDQLMGIGRFLETKGSFRVFADLLFIGVFGGFYSVPLFAFIQKRTAAEYRARVIAASNILNALFMAASNLAAMFLLALMNVSIPQFFLILAILNIMVAIYIFTVVPEFTMRFLIWILSHTMYRVSHKHLDYIPDEGPAVLV
ncbi:MAG: MFS transporter, partial [bacterium]|nr:MFS transporter [bacterium]